MASLLLELHELQLVFVCDNSPTVQIVQQALQGMSLREVAEPPAQQCRTLAIEFDGQRWFIQDAHQNKSLTGAKIGDFAYHLTDCIAYHLADQSKVHYCLHAGAVVINRKAVLIVGASGAGKSTLTAWLVAQGAAYITDELSLLHPDGGVVGLPRAIQIKRQGVAAVQGLVNDPTAILDGDLVQGISAAALQGRTMDAMSAPSLGAIVFPEYQAEQAFEMSKLSSAQAGMQLMANYINARNFAEHGFDGLMSLVETVPAYSLRYSNFDSLQEVFAFEAENSDDLIYC